MTILVTGATGTIGSRLLTTLLHEGHSPRAMIHHPDSRTRLPSQVDHVHGDYADPASLDHALRGIDRVFLVAANGPDQVTHETAMIDAAVRAGVERIVKVSAHGADAASPVAFWRWHADIDNHLRESGIPSVSLRPTFSMANILGHADDTRNDSIVVAPEAAAPITMIDPQDVADVAAAMLTAQSVTHDQQVIELTGPAGVTFPELATELTALTGRPIAYVPVTDEQTRTYLGGRGVPPFVIEQILAIFAVLRAGGQSSPTTVVPDLLGRQGRTLGEFLHQNAHAFLTPATVAG